MLCREVRVALASGMEVVYRLLRLMLAKEPTTDQNNISR